jgi:hypothetical protein
MILPPAAEAAYVREWRAASGKTTPNAKYPVRPGDITPVLRSELTKRTESGDDYLYHSSHFGFVDFPASVKKQILAIGRAS